MSNHTDEITTHEHHHAETPHPGASCLHLPPLTRLKYSYGLMLGAQDFQAEQNFFREKIKLHNRCLHGYGTVCGLKVVPKPTAADCEPKTATERAKLETELTRLEQELKSAEQTGQSDVAQHLHPQAEDLRRKLKKLQKDSCHEEPPTLVLIECGFALDCEGNELVVHRPLPVDLWRELDPKDKRRVDPQGQTLYLSLCYCEQPTDPVRPVLQDACGAVSDCVYSKLRDAVRVKVTIDPPPSDRRCETCCSPCLDPCLLLAEIHCFKRGQPLKADQIHNNVRRMISLYAFSTISGISWTHGATYSQEEANEIIGTDDKSKGLKIQFSRPVLKSTLKPGVVDLWVLTGGPGQSGDVTKLDGDYGTFSSAKTVSEFRYRQTTGESLNAGDRVLIMVRSAFILDECCRPVDGAHIGGRVPIITPEFSDFDKREQLSECATPPGHYGPWTSGTGSPGGTFESWFYVEPKKGAYRK